jgi:hypothetical protein
MAVQPMLVVIPHLLYCLMTSFNIILAPTLVEKLVLSFFAVSDTRHGSHPLHSRSSQADHSGAPGTPGYLGW